jgi:hypothetical protein
VSEFINTIDALGDEVVIDSIIDRSITEFKDNRVTNIGNYAFHSCVRLSEVNLPNVTHMGTYVLTNCSSLKKVELPKLRNMISYSNAQNWFQGCTSLETITLPSVEELGQFRAFDTCTSLAYADFPVLTALGNYTFVGCKALKLLVLRRNDSIVPLRGNAAFGSTPIEYGTGCIYVPRALISSYKAATNWSAVADRFRVLEDWTVDGTTTGELVTIFSIQTFVSGAEIDNTQEEIAEGRPYQATITHTDNNPLESVSILMGGVDVTQDVYDDKTGQVNIPHVTGDIVITAKTNVLYNLPAPKTFSGTNDYIDTNVGLFTTPSDFTILLEFGDDGSAAPAYAHLFHCMDESVSIRPGIRYERSGASGGHELLGWTDGSKTTARYDRGLKGATRVAIVYQNGILTNLKYMRAGAVRSAEYNPSGAVYVPHNWPLVIGAKRTGKNKYSNFWKGTVNQLTIYNRAYSNDECLAWISES